jgi:transposase-like protein
MAQEDGLQGGGAGAVAGQAVSDELPKCPHCDTTLKPERLGLSRYVCPSCAREFRTKE